MALFPIGESEIKMVFREPYLTQGLNRKMARVVPRGAYEGFMPHATGAFYTIDFLPSTEGDRHVAIYTSDDNISLSVLVQGGPIGPLVLPGSLANTTYILVLTAAYSITAETTASIEAYTQAQFDAFSVAEQEQFIRFGRALTDGTGIVTVDLNGRTYPWENIPPAAKPWKSIIKNPFFGYSDPGVLDTGNPTVGTKSVYDPAFPFWVTAAFTAGAEVLTLTLDGTDSVGPGGNSLLLSTDSSPTNLSAFVLLQDSTLAPVPITNTEYRVRLVYKTHQTITSGSMGVEVTLNETIGGANIPRSLGSLNFALADVGTWQVFEATIPYDSSLSPQQNFYVGMIIGGLSPTVFPDSGDIVSIGEVQVSFPDPVGNIDPAFGGRALTNSYFRTIFEDPTDSGPSPAPIYLQTNQDQEAFVFGQFQNLVLDRADQSESVSPAQYRAPFFYGAGGQGSYLKRPVFYGVNEQLAGVFGAASSGSSPPVWTLMSEGTQFTDNCFPVSIGCYYDPESGTEEWIRPSFALPAFKMEIGATTGTSGANVQALSIFRKIGPASTWADNDWTDTPIYIPFGATLASDLLGNIAGGIAFGSELPDTNAGAVVPRLQLTAPLDTTTKVLLGEYGDPGTREKVRLYSSGRLESTVMLWSSNAEYDPTTAQWTKEVTGNTSTFVEYTRSNGYRIKVIPTTTAGPFTNALLGTVGYTEVTADAVEHLLKCAASTSGDARVLAESAAGTATVEVDHTASDRFGKMTATSAVAQVELQYDADQFVSLYANATDTELLLQRRSDEYISAYTNLATTRITGLQNAGKSFNLELGSVDSRFELDHDLEALLILTSVDTDLHLNASDEAYALIDGTNLSRVRVFHSGGSDIDLVVDATKASLEIDSSTTEARLKVNFSASSTRYVEAFVDSSGSSLEVNSAATRKVSLLATGSESRVEVLGPHPSTPDPKSLYYSNIPAAWGSVSSSSGTVTVDSEFGVASVSIVTSGAFKYFKVTLDNAMSGLDEYMVVAQSQTTDSGSPVSINTFSPTVTKQTTTIFYMAMLSPGGIPADLSTGGYNVGFNVFGKVA